MEFMDQERDRAYALERMSEPDAWPGAWLALTSSASESIADGLTSWRHLGIEERAALERMAGALDAAADLICEGLRVSPEWLADTFATARALAFAAEPERDGTSLDDGEGVA